MSIPSSMSLSNPPLRSGWLHSPASLKNPYLGLKASQTGFSPSRFPLLCSSLSPPLAHYFCWPPSVLSCGPRILHPFLTTLNLLAPFSTCTAQWALPVSLFGMGPPIASQQALVKTGHSFLLPLHSTQSNCRFSPSFLRAPLWQALFSSHQTTQRKIPHNNENNCGQSVLWQPNRIFLFGCYLSFFVGTTNLKWQVTAHC